MFDNQMAEKKRIEDGAMALQRKMNQVGPPASLDAEARVVLLSGLRRLIRRDSERVSQPRPQVPRGSAQTVPVPFTRISCTSTCSAS